MGLGGSKKEPEPSYTDSTKGYTSALTGGLVGIKDRAYEYYEYGENYPYFCAVFLTGCLFIVLSCFFIPVIVVSPYKTANLFNMGCSIILISFAVLHGPKEYCINRFLCGPSPRNYFAAGFLVCIVLCIYVSVFKRSFILTLLVLIIEVGCLVFFLMSYFPGGVNGVSKLFTTIWSSIKGLGKLCDS